MASSVASLFSSFISSAHADTEEKADTEGKADTEEKIGTEEKQAPKEAPTQEEEETPEPEDAQPIIQEECKHSKCATLTKHFEHCQEKVHSGHGFKGEDCVEELCKCLDYFLLYTPDSDINFFHGVLVHMMHCVDNCAAPKLFAKLR